MNSSDNFKLVWWLILVVTIGLYINGRYDELIKGNSSYFDTVVFLVWIGICLAPIFKEMNLFGVKLKQDISDLKKDMNHQLSILKTEIKSSIEVSSANNNQIYVNTNQEPPKDSEIPDLSALVQEAVSKLGITAEPVEKQDDKSKPVELEMFEIRFSFEQLLRKYLYLFEDKPMRRSSLGTMLANLRHLGIPKDIIIPSREVVAICNYAVHGEPLTDKQISFVRESSPSLLKALKSSLENAL
jgi:hypothetical protein